MSGSIRLTGGIGLSGGGLRYPSARYALDLARGHYEIAGRVRKNLGDITGFAFSRASTATYFGPAGTMLTAASGAPRFAYDPITLASLGLQAEGARTNLFLWSQDLDNAAWTKTTATVSANAGTAPDGTATADKLVEDSSNAQHRISQGVNTTNGVVYTSSFIAKADTRLGVYVRLLGVGALAQASFNLQAGTVTSNTTGSATILPILNGWYICSVTGTADGVSAITYINLLDTAGGTTVASYQGDGTSGLYLWGFQMEAGGGASSYIPTTTAAVTRAAELATLTLSNVYPIGLSVAWRRLSSSGVGQTIAQLDTGSDAQRVNASVRSSNLFAAVSSGASNSTVAGSTAVGTDYKGSIRIATNNNQSARGGTLGTAITTATNPTSPTRLVIGSADSSGEPLFGTVSRVLIHVGEPTDAQLQARSA